MLTLLTKDEYKRQLKKYRREVLKHIRKQPLFQLDNYVNRGKGYFHLDHIISIKFGFDNKIDPELIGNIVNLRYVYYKDNLSKRDYLTQESFDVFNYLIDSGINV